MIHYGKYMTDMSYEYDLHKEVDGTICTMHIVLPHGTHTTTRFDEINPDTRSFMRCGGFVAPLDRLQRARFLEYLLQFNRNSLTVMNFGFVPDPHARNSFAPIWYIPKYAQSVRDWDQQMGLFEVLIKTCSADLHKMTSEWTASYLH